MLVLIAVYSGIQHVVATLYGNVLSYHTFDELLFLVLFICGLLPYMAMFTCCHRITIFSTLLLPATPSQGA